MHLITLTSRMAVVGFFSGVLLSVSGCGDDKNDNKGKWKCSSPSCFGDQNSDKGEEK